MAELLRDAQVMTLDPETVEVPPRIGFLHEEVAIMLGRSMAVDGQTDPIKVAPNKKGAAKEWRLVAGLHRLEGARREGIPVYALPVDGTAEELVLIEVSENLHRRDMAPLERAKMVAALVHAKRDQIAREHGDLKPQQMAIRLRWERVKANEETADQALDAEVADTTVTMTGVYGPVQSAMEAFGLSEPSIHRDLKLFRLIIEPFPTLVEQLSQHPVVGRNASDLRKIAGVEYDGHRRRVIETLLANPELTVRGAMDLATGATAPAGQVHYQKHFNAINGGWKRLGAPERKRFLIDELVPKLTPGEMRLLRDRLAEKLGEQTGAKAEDYEEGTLARRILEEGKL